jgi:hypothetical protein
MTIFMRKGQDEEYKSANAHSGRMMETSACNETGELSAES